MARAHEKLMKPDIAKKEEDIYNATIKWITHDAAGRRQHVTALIEHVRLPLVTAKFLTTAVSSQPLISNHCNQYLMDAMTYQLQKCNQLPAEETARTKGKHPRCLYRFQSFNSLLSQ